MPALSPIAQCTHADPQHDGKLYLGQAVALADALDVQAVQVEGERRFFSTMGSPCLLSMLKDY
jgi:hypothetical protein